MESEKPSDFLVYIVEDDEAVRHSLSQMLQLLGYGTRVFDSAESFLNAYSEDWEGCIVADLRLPGLSGIEMQSALLQKGRRMPFVIVTGHGDVPAARKAFKENAIDFVEKPIDEMVLLAAIDSARKSEALYRHERIAKLKISGQLAKLTPREKEILSLVGQGLPAKEIAERLGISPRTAEVHRANILEKTGARNGSELVRLALSAEGHLFKLPDSAPRLEK